MLIVALVTAFSATLTVAAPLPVYYGNYLTLYRRAFPTFQAPDHLVPSREQHDTIARMEQHYSTQASSSQRNARLVSAASRWTPVSHDHETMAISYHEGDTTGTPIIGSLGQIHRDRLGPKVDLSNVKGSDRHEMREASLKQFHDSPNPGVSERVKSIKVLGNWDRNGGMLEKTTMSYHSSIRPSQGNAMGPPVTVNRPLTLNLPGIPPEHKESVEQAIRGAHGSMASVPNHPASLANYGTAHTPTQYGPTNKQLVVGMEHVSEDERVRTHLGTYAINTGPLDHRPDGGAPSHAGPSSEASRPTRSDQASNTGIGPPPASSSSSDAMSVNPPGSPPSDSEATSQFAPAKKQRTS